MPTDARARTLAADGRGLSALRGLPPLEGGLAASVRCALADLMRS